MMLHSAKGLSTWFADSGNCSIESAVVAFGDVDVDVGGDVILPLQDIS